MDGFDDGGGTGLELREPVEEIAGLGVDDGTIGTGSAGDFEDMEGEEGADVDVGIRFDEGEMGSPLESTDDACRLATGEVDPEDTKTMLGYDPPLAGS